MTSVRHACSRRGSVLVLALWVLFLLVAVAVALARVVSGVLDAVIHLREGERAHRAAVSAMERARFLAAAATNTWDGVQESAWNRAPVLGEMHPSVEGLTASIRFESVRSDGTSVTNTGLAGEEGRVNLNEAAEALLAGVYRARTGADEDAARAWAAAVVAWRSKSTTADGAESARASWAARTGQVLPAEPGFRTPAELFLMQPGADEATELLLPLVTVHGSGKINLNAADWPVLAGLAMGAGAAPEVARTLADRIVGAREAGVVFDSPSAGAIRERLADGGRLPPEESAALEGVMPHACIRSSAFRGRAEGGGAADGRPGETIEFVVETQTGHLLYFRIF